MKTQIQQLVAAGRTEEALTLFATVGGNDAVLLQSRYAGGKRQFNMGVLEPSEWQRQQNQINFALLDLVANLPDSGPAVPPQVPQNQAAAPLPKPAQATKPRVFISYNHADWATMRLVKAFLEDKKIEVTVDVQHMSIGTEIQDFIDEALRTHEFVLSIISENSLLSGWVNVELGAALMLQRFAQARWLPVRIDNACFEDAFYEKAAADIARRIQEKTEAIQKALASGDGIEFASNELTRLRRLKADLSPSIQAIRERLSADISGPLFDVGMEKVANQILGKK